MAKLTRQEQAQALALRGDTDAAVAALQDLKRGGGDAASASLAVIAAFRYQWSDVLSHAEVIFGAPSCIDTLNVYTDMVQLTARAAASLGNWSDVQDFAKTALKKLKGIEDNEAHAEAVRRLARLAARKGEGARFTLEDADATLAKRQARFDAALVKLAKEPKKRFKTSADRLDHLFGLACVLDYHGGAVQVFDEERALPNIFDNVAFAASALARVGRTDEAWNAVHTKLPSWWPVEATQIAPVVLLADWALSEVMTPERCELVLRCPRGPGAE